MISSLLAKGHLPNRPAPSLIQHTLDVVDAAAALFGSATNPSRLGQEWLRFFRLPQSAWLGFHEAFLASCLLHDLGKANDRMQNILAGTKDLQLFRHEHLSVLLIASDGVNAWLGQRIDIDWEIVLAAVGSHHLKFRDEDLVSADPGNAVRMLTDHPEFSAQLLPAIAAGLNLEGHPHFPARIFWGTGVPDDSTVFDPAPLWETMRARLRSLTLASRDKSHHRGRLLNAVRSALITADAAGSGLRRTGQSVAGWIHEQDFDTRLCDGTVVDRIMGERIADLSMRNKWRDWNEFQIACDALQSRSLLLAPCGAGKTLGAWRWVSAQVKQRPVKRVIFLYPTRATATEGFKDYVSWAPEADANLLHGTADYDLNEMFPAEDPRTGQIYNGTDPRLFAIRHWGKRIFSSTIDQFFGFLSYGYGPMCLLPVLADSVLVIDEVHSFDSKMFSALLGFLENFNVPVLCMTATLQAGRKEQLRRWMEQVYEDRPGELSVIADSPRYRVKMIAENEVLNAISDAVDEGKRVLCVVNQVSRAQELALRLRSATAQVVCYHSRFKLDDRVSRHRETVAMIRAGAPASVAVSTQVCEMSLDIDADLLITEECPIASLIQRMGRCRRGRDELANKGPGEVYVYKPARECVYSKQDLQGLAGFLGTLTAKSAVSQTDLEQAMEKFGAKTADAPRLNSFLASGAYAVAGEDSFRDIEAFNLPAVLDSEVDSFLSSRGRQPGFIVPVPKKLKPQKDARLPSYLFVGSKQNYDGLTGYWDNPLP